MTTHFVCLSTEQVRCPTSVLSCVQALGEMLGAVVAAAAGSPVWVSREGTALTRAPSAWERAVSALRNWMRGRGFAPHSGYFWKARSSCRAGLAAPVSPRRLLLPLSQQPRSCGSAHFLLLFQDNVLNIINQIMDVCIPQDRAPRDFCVKFPEEIRHDNLAGQLWFGAEVVGGRLGLGSRCWAVSSRVSMKLSRVHLQVEAPLSPSRSLSAVGYGWC